MSRLEKKWWFVLIVSILTVLTTQYLLDMAGIRYRNDSTPAKWAVYFFCFFGIGRAFSFLGWLIALTLAPKLVVPARESQETGHT